MVAQMLLKSWKARAATIIFMVAPQIVTGAPLRFFRAEVSSVDQAKLADLTNANDVVERLKANYPELLALAIPSDARSAPAHIRYYGRALQGQAEGQFRAAGDPVDDPARPYLNQDLIVFREHTPRYVVQHEVLHYLIDLSEREHGGGVVDLKNRLNEVVARGANNDIIDLLNLRLDVLKRSSFEEISMVEFMLTERARLGLSDSQAREELNFGAGQLAGASRNFQEIVSEAVQHTSAADPRRAQLFHRLGETADNIDSVTNFFRATACELELR